MNAHLVHGFNVKDGGKGTLDLLKPYLRLETIDHDYGWFGLLRVRLCNGSVAETIKSIAKDGDIGIGHSNGCAILCESVKRGANLAGLVFINPALDSDCVVSAHVKWVHVYHNDADRAVSVSRWLLGHPWGDMGRRGFQGSDKRYINFNCGPEVQGHSDIFTKLGVWGPKISRNIAKALKVRKAA